VPVAISSARPSGHASRYRSRTGDGSGFVGYSSFRKRSSQVVIEGSLEPYNCYPLSGVGDLVSQLTDAVDELGVTVRIVPADEWTHGEAKGICEQLSLVDMQARVEVRNRENDADLARTLVHEYAHVLLHFDVDDDTKRSKREVDYESPVPYRGRRESKAAV